MAIKIMDRLFEIDVSQFIANKDIGIHLKLNKFFNIAKNLSLLSKFDTYRFGAVITLKDKVITKGYNSPKSHPIQKYYNDKFKHFINDNSQHGIHAEMSALNELKQIIKNTNIDVKKLQITIYRSDKEGNSKMARPCAGCMAAIKEIGIPIVNYTTPNGIATELILNKELKIKKAKKLI